MNLITTIEHVFAAAAQDIVKVAKYVQSEVLPAAQKVEAAATTVEAITGLVNPAAVNIERMAFAGLGAIIKAIEDAGSAAAAGGVNVALDAAMVADFKNIIPAILAASAPLMASVTPAAK